MLSAAKEYDAFGNIIPNSASGTWIGRFTYQGQSWLEITSSDASKRLLLSPTRIYDPVTGRFLQNEPLIYRRPYWHYLYSTVNWVDPRGSLNLASEATYTSPLMNEFQKLTPAQYKCLKLAVQRVEYWLDATNSAYKDFIGPLLPDPIPQKVQKEISARGGNLSALAQHSELFELPEGSQSMTILPYTGSAMGHSGSTGEAISINKRLLTGCVNSPPPNKCRPGQADTDYFIELIAETIVHEISHNLNVRAKGTARYVDESSAHRELGFEAEHNIWGRILGVDKYTGDRSTSIYDPATGKIIPQ